MRSIRDDDDFWLEGGAAEDPGATIPIRRLTKRELADATGYTLTKLDKLVRAGLPARRTGSRREGLRFDLADVIEWIAEHRAVAFS